MEDEYLNIGKIDLTKTGKFKDKAITEETILTLERIEHIKSKHNDEYIQLHEYIIDIITDPDYIIEDNAHDDTLIYLKHISEIDKKARIVIKLATNIEDKKYNKNSIITLMRQREKSWKQTLKNRGKIIYKKLDKNE